MTYTHTQKKRGIIFSIFLMGAVMVIGMMQNMTSTKAATCPLTTLRAYRTVASPSVYYISEDCKKRPIRNPQVYFSHFTSWGDVQITVPSVLNKVPDHGLSFLPWGPRRIYLNGSLIKTVSDPKVYLILNNTSVYPIDSEIVFRDILGYTFDQVEDVVPAVIQKYRVAGAITSATSVPPTLIFKYPNDSKVFITERSANGDELTKRYVETLAQITASNYRTDRIATLPSSRVFEPATGVSTVLKPAQSVTPAQTQSTPPRPGAPVVSLIAPEHSTTYISPVTIALKATAIDPNGIASVSFYDRTRLLHTRTVPPYSFEWTDASVGTHIITARAVDKTNVEGVSGAVTVIVEASAIPLPEQSSTPPPATPTPAPPPAPTPTPVTPILPIATSTPAPTPTPTGAVVNARSAIGINIGFINDFSANWLYVDQFKSARPWVSGLLSNYCWDCGPALDVDANGWVRSLPAGVVAHTPVLTNYYGGTDPRSFYPAGRYTVLYDGEGTLAYSGAATRNADLSRAGRDVIDVTSYQNSSLILEIQSTNPNNYMRNIRVYPPGGSCSNDQTRYCTTNNQCDVGNTCRIFAETTNPQTFHPNYLRNNRAMSVVRLMQPGLTNEPGIERVVNPSDYSHRADAVWFRMPPEVVGELATRLHSDVWVNIPVNASDALVRDIATRLHSTLSAQSRVYVEYSNESWNGAYPYIQQQQILTVRGCQNNTDLQAGCDQDTNVGNNVYCENHPWPTYNQSCAQAEMRQFSERTVQIGEIFRDVFGVNGRVIRVMATQAGSTYRTGILLAWRNAYQNIDVVAIAPYFGNSLDDDPATQNLSLDGVFTRIQNIELPAALASVSDDIAFLRQNYPTLDLIAYEGGQHLVTAGANYNNAIVQDLFARANNDPRMGTLYTTYLNGWRERGGKTMVLYSDVTPQSSYGSFGALVSRDQPHEDSPKFTALENFALTNPCWWTGCEYGGAWVGRGGSVTNPTPSSASTSSSSVSANLAPSVSVTAPVNGSTYTAPGPIIINATASDSDGSIARVSFYSDSTLLGQDTTAPYSYSWPPFVQGTYTITARATDNSGATTISNAVTVIVSPSNQASASPPSPPPNEDIAGLSDEFSSSATLANWTQIQDTEGWGFTQLERYDINQSRAGWMTMVPYASVWYQDYRGVLSYKQAQGDFIISTRAHVSNRAGTGAPGSSYSLGGIMVRAPRAITPQTWTPGGENYVFLSIGTGENVGTYQYEAKTTVNSNSDLQTSVAGPEAELRIVRINSRFFLLMSRLTGGSWRVIRRFDRTDLPSDLQIGLTTYTDWNTAGSYSPQAQNTTQIRTGNPDLIAEFDYMRFARPNLTSTQTNRNWLDANVVSDAEVISLFGM